MKQLLEVISTILLTILIGYCFVYGIKDNSKIIQNTNNQIVIDNRDSLQKIWLDSTHIRVMFCGWYKEQYLRNVKRSK